MLRALIIFTGAALCTGVIGCVSPGPRQTVPPNVVLISIDTLRADRLNAYGYRLREVSPAIDHLAAEGILFENQITPSPWTTPAHMSLLTGLSPSAHGVIAPLRETWGRLKKGEASQRLADEHVTLAEALSSSGYATAAFTGGRTVDPRTGFDQGFEIYDTSQAKLRDGSLVAVTEWIQAHRDAPFFLFWHTFEVHAPYLQTDFVREVLPERKAARLERAIAGVEDGRPTVVLHEKKMRRRLVRLGLYTLEVCSALYDGGVLSADRAVGTLMAALKEASVYDRTLVVVTSDHGERLGETAGPGAPESRDGRFYNAHGATLYEEITRVPLIVKLPEGTPAGRRVAGVSRGIDVMPTVLDVLGIAAPSTMQGRSLRPLWEGSGEAGREAFTEAVTQAFESKSLRSDRHKYILSFDPDQVRTHGRAAVPERADIVELYDLHADPGEQHNLMIDPTPEAAAVGERFDAELRQVAGERRGEAAGVLLDPETLEQIRALGYAE